MQNPDEHPDSKPCITYRIDSGEHYICLEEKKRALTCNHATSNDVFIYCTHPSRDSFASPRKKPSAVQF